MSLSTWIGIGLQAASTAYGIYSQYSASQSAASKEEDAENSARAAAKAAEKAAERQAEESKRAASENAAISRYDASVAEKDALAAEYKAGIELKIHLKSVDKLLGAQRARLGKSGVALGEGSPKTLLIETAAEARKDAEMIKYNGMTAAQRRRDAAKRYRMLADAGLRDAAAHATLIEEAGHDEAMSYLAKAKTYATAADTTRTQGIYSAINTGLQGISQIGTSAGWW